MDEEDVNSGLLGIALSDSEDDSNGKAEAQLAPISREDRNAQSEEEFQRLKAVYKVKVENGEVWKQVEFPFGDKVSKPAAQEVVHAVEELYFFRRYAEALDFIRRVWREGGGKGGGLDNDSRELLSYYEKKCQDKIGVQADVGMA